MQENNKTSINKKMLIDVNAVNIEVNGN